MNPERAVNVNVRGVMRSDATAAGGSETSTDKMVTEIGRMTRATREAGERDVRLCPLIAFDQFVGGKYKLRTLWSLRAGARRYGEIRRSVVTACQGKPVSARVLSRELKELERRGLITRREYPGKHRRVEYTATDAGRKLDAVVQEIINWGLTGAHEVSPALEQAAERLGKRL